MGCAQSHKSKADSDELHDLGRADSVGRQPQEASELEPAADLSEIVPSVPALVTAPAAAGAQLADRYFKFEALLTSVRSGAVAPLRGSFIIKTERDGGKLLRRQEMPREAFWTADELSQLYEQLCSRFGKGEGSARFGRCVVALSYRWLQKGCPDTDDGFHLKRVASFAKLYMRAELPTAVFTPLGMGEDQVDFAMFWCGEACEVKPASVACLIPLPQRAASQTSCERPAGVASASEDRLAYGSTGISRRSSSRHAPTARRRSFAMASSGATSGMATASPRLGSRRSYQTALRTPLTRTRVG